VEVAFADLNAHTAKMAAAPNALHAAWTLDHLVCAYFAHADVFHPPVVAFSTSVHFAVHVGSGLSRPRQPFSKIALVVFGSLEVALAGCGRGVLIIAVIIVANVAAAKKDAVIATAASVRSATAASVRSATATTAEVCYLILSTILNLIFIIPINIAQTANAAMLMDATCSAVIVCARACLHAVRCYARAGRVATTTSRTKTAHTASTTKTTHSSIALSCSCLTLIM
jgi:hypothetical protein